MHRAAELDDRVLLHELRLLEVRRQSGGVEKIDHPVRSFCHDDVANASIGALLLAASGPVAGEYGQQGAVTRSLCDYEPMSFDDERRERGTSQVDARRGLPPKLPPIMYN